MAGKHGRMDGGGRGRHQRICSMGGAPRRVLCLCNRPPPGVFSAMLWYSKYQDHETMMVTGQIFSICSEATASVGISEENCNHLIRAFRAFLGGTFPARQQQCLWPFAACGGQLRVLLKAADCRHEGSGGQIALDKRIYYQTEKAPQDLSQSCGAFSMRNSGAEII